MALKNKIRESLSPENIIIDDNFWKKRLDVNSGVSLLYQYEQFEKTGTLKNFENAINKKQGEHYGLFFSDASLYKWVEAACYSQISCRNEKLAGIIEEVVRLIAAAQEADGYLNTYFQIREPAKKFTNFGIGHELYCAGHLMEAAVAHFRATKSKKLLAAAVAFADHIDSVIGPGKLEVTTGHQELEIALILLYRTTGEKRYLRLAEFLLNSRGKTTRFLWECEHLEAIGGKFGKPGQTNIKHFYKSHVYDGRYIQDHLPVREQRRIVGHAVRALYMYCGMADLYIETAEDQLLTTLREIWKHATSRVMYVTGGIGASRENEGITGDYHLPTETICAETCAAVGMAMWSHRMLNITGESQFADVLERVLYNGFLVSVSLGGKEYFYNNSLESNGREHRQGWYECACCPPNTARLFSRFGTYVYSYVEDVLSINLFVKGRAKLIINQTPVCFNVDTDYPWDGRVNLTYDGDQPVVLELAIRIPAWCDNYTIMPNGEQTEYRIAGGYAKIRRQWLPGDTLAFNMDMPVKYINAHPLVEDNYGKIAIMRGPLIYCIEEQDYEIPLDQIILPQSNVLQANYVPDLLGGVVLLEGTALTPEMQSWEDSLYQCEPEYRKINFKAVPYYAWDNRRPGAMAVWIKNCY